MLGKLITFFFGDTAWFNRTSSAPAIAKSLGQLDRGLGEGLPLKRRSLARETHQNLDLRNRRFDDLNASKATFVSCDFSYSIFNRSYFHGAKFENCFFVGCRFYDSNMRGASFYRCDLKYASFQRTVIEPDEILATLPPEPNLRRDSLQNLRANAMDIGDYDSQRAYVLEEIKAKADHLSRAFHGSESYYRRKYGTIIAKAKAGFELLMLRLGGFVWGHGERPSLILVSSILLILVLSLVNFWSVLPRLSWAESGYGWEIFRYSFDVFLGTQPKPKFRGFIPIDYILVVSRYVYIGLLISVLNKNMAHR